MWNSGHLPVLTEEELERLCEKVFSPGGLAEEAEVGLSLLPEKGSGVVMAVAARQQRWRVATDCGAKAEEIRPRSDKSRAGGAWGVMSRWWLWVALLLLGAGCLGLAALLPTEGGGLEDSGQILAGRVSSEGSEKGLPLTPVGAGQTGSERASGASEASASESGAQGPRVLPGSKYVTQRICELAPNTWVLAENPETTGNEGVDYGKLDATDYRILQVRMPKPEGGELRLAKNRRRRVNAGRYHYPSVRTSVALVCLGWFYVFMCGANRAALAAKVTLAK